MFYWLLKWVLLGPVLKRIFRPYAEGTEHVPEEGPAILASNHLSYSDWLFMPLVIPRRVTFVAKAEYFTGRGLKGWLQRSFFSGAGQVPIDRSSGSAAAGAIATGLKVLGKGDLFGIYPEGTRSPRRPAVPRPDRRRADGAGRQGARSSRSPSSVPTWSRRRARSSAATPART